MDNVSEGTLVVYSLESPQTPDQDIKEEYMWTFQFKSSPEAILLQEKGWIWCKEEGVPKPMVYLKKKRVSD